MSAHVFVDESKSRGYLLAAAIVPEDDVARSGKRSTPSACPGNDAFTSRLRATGAGR
jgi:hypothetical protein